MTFGKQPHLLTIFDAVVKAKVPHSRIRLSSSKPILVLVLDMPKPVKH